MHIQQIMSQPAITCRASENLDRAAQLMWDHDIGALPVVDGDDQIIGMITDRDICMAAYTRGQALASIPVSGAMARVVYSLRGDHTIDDAEALMRAKQIRRIPVLDGDNRAAGVVSLNDIARHVAASKKNGVTQRGVVDTLNTICARRGHALEKAPSMAMQQQRTP